MARPRRGAAGPRRRSGAIRGGLIGARLFVALPVPDDVAGVLDRTLDAVRAGLPTGVASDLRWVGSDAFHVTLRFLGDTDPRRVDEVADAMLGATADTRPFELRLGRLVSLGGRRAGAHVLELDEGRDAVARLASRLDVELAAHGWPPESRPFRPHLTLARVRRGDGHAAREPLMRAVAPLDLRFEVARVVLFESHLGPGRPRYEPRVVAEL